MPIAGVDDILFILLSTTVLILAKRNDDEKKKDLSSKAPVTSENDYLRRTYGFTPLLLPAIDSPVQQPAGPCAVIERSRVTAVVPLPPPYVHQRPFSFMKHILQVSSLASVSEVEVSGLLHKFSPSQVSSLFRELENDGLWEAAIRVSKGISLSGESLRYLTPANVERVIKTLLNDHQEDKALDYYFSYGVDILLPDDLLLLLFDSCRSSKQRSVQLLHHLIPFQSRWSATVYACCLTVAAQRDPPHAIDLYQTYLQLQQAERRRNEGPLRRLLSGAALLQESGVVSVAPPTKLRHLYHIIVPLVVQHFPEQTKQYVIDMLENDPSAAPDVFLKCLQCDHRDYVLPYIADYITQREDEEEESTRSLPDIAEVLYRMSPTPMNLNSLISLYISLEKQSIGNLCAVNPTTYCERLHAVLPTITLDSMQARVITRTVTEQKASWRMASLFASSMLQQQHFSVVPQLSRHLSSLGKWSLAATALSVYMSSRRNCLTSAEVGMCVEACAKSRKWGSTLFWIDRASSAGIVLPTEIYDVALGITKHISWEDTTRLVRSICHAGGKWSEDGYLQLAEGCAHKGRMEDMLRLMKDTQRGPGSGVR